MTHPTTPSPTVFVVDDDLDLRESLAMLIDALGFPVKPFVDGVQFHRAYQGEPGCLLLDICLPYLSGIELYEQLLREGKRLPVIFMTAHADVSTAVAAMKTGAIEFLEKPFDKRRLAQKIASALELDADWRKRDSEFARVNERIARLTATDLETLELLIAGESNKNIAARIDISERAVERRRARLMSKLGARSLAELLDIAITHRVLNELRVTATLPPFRIG